MRRFLLTSSLVALVLGVSSPAFAQEPPTPAAVRFGEPGQWVLGGSTSLGVQHEGFSKTSETSFEASGSLGLDRFVLRNVSVGLDAGAGYSSARVAVPGVFGSSDQNSAWVSVGPRVGVNVPLGDRISFFPRVTLGVAWRRDFVPLAVPDNTGAIEDPSFPDGFARSSFGLWTAAYAPVLFHVAPHFFVGVGPRVYANFADDPTAQIQRPRVRAGLALEVGGHWGGDPDAAVADAPEDPAAARYGAKGTFVLTNALGFSAEVRTYKYASSVNAVAIEPSGDYFVANDVSLGVSAGYAREWSGEAHQDRVELAPRVGVALPISARVRVHPHASLGVGSLKSSGGSSEAGTYDYVWVGLDAPVLVDVAPGFFVGFGPRLEQELARHYDAGSDGNRLTRVAADGVLGGWF